MQHLSLTADRRCEASSRVWGQRLRFGRNQVRVCTSFRTKPCYLCRGLLDFKSDCTFQYQKRQNKPTYIERWSCDPKTRYMEIERPPPPQSHRPFPEEPSGHIWFGEASQVVAKSALEQRRKPYPQQARMSWPCKSVAADLCFCTFPEEGSSELQRACIMSMTR